MRRLILTAVGLVCIGAAPPSVGDAPNTPAAVILRAAGVPVTDDGAVTPRVGSFLEPGELLLPPAAGRLVLLLHDGSTVAVDEPLVVPEPEGDQDRLFRLLRALLSAPEETRHEVPEPAPEARTEANAHPVPVRPAGDRRVRAITPELVWQSAEGAEAYRVHIWSPDNELLEMGAGADTAWVLPPESALTPGTSYTWAVTPLPGTAMGPRARFRVASREVLDDVARELGGLRARGLDPEGDGLLLAAALFRSMALPYDAHSLLEDLRERGDPWSEQVEAFDARLRAELADPGLLPDGTDPGMTR